MFMLLNFLVLFTCILLFGINLFMLYCSENLLDFSVLNLYSIGYSIVTCIVLYLQYFMSNAKLSKIFGKIASISITACTP